MIKLLGMKFFVLCLLISSAGSLRLASSIEARNNASRHSGQPVKSLNLVKTQSKKGEGEGDDEERGNDLQVHPQAPLIKALLFGDFSAILGMDNNATLAFFPWAKILQDYADWWLKTFMPDLFPKITTTTTTTATMTTATATTTTCNSTNTSCSTYVAPVSSEAHHGHGGGHSGRRRRSSDATSTKEPQGSYTALQLNIAVRVEDCATVEGGCPNEFPTGVGKYYVFTPKDPFPTAWDGMPGESISFLLPTPAAWGKGFKEGMDLVFDQSDPSNSDHPLRLSKTPDGVHGGGTKEPPDNCEDDEGGSMATCKPPGTEGASVEYHLIPDSVGQLYLYCEKHPNMLGGLGIEVGAIDYDHNEMSLKEKKEEKEEKDILGSWEKEEKERKEKEQVKFSTMATSAQESMGEVPFPSH